MDILLKKIFFQMTNENKKIKKKGWERRANEKRNGKGKSFRNYTSTLI